MRRLVLIIATAVLMFGPAAGTEGATKAPATKAPAAKASEPAGAVADRAVAGAQAYLKKIGVDKLEQNMMLTSLFAKAQPKYLHEWEKLTGIKIKTVEFGYTEIPAKIMADAVAKSGQYDIYNHQMYMVPDAGRVPGAPPPARRQGRRRQ